MWIGAPQSPIDRDPSVRSHSWHTLRGSFASLVFISFQSTIYEGVAGAKKGKRMKRMRKKKDEEGLVQAWMRAAPQNPWCAGMSARASSMSAAPSVGPTDLAAAFNAASIRQHAPPATTVAAGAGRS
nr:hypothetical protein [Pandoravirus massiliensis]